ncbi:MAG: dihydroorotate dehydrogenase electron transfer subunit [Synergistaceae bacterium]|jgi:dihydroorotate dehydrogenase electron transfer subunit|nr:dihydroorotate dehydrogenase electron transfer subunit [Synergistaceae bacterium]
MTGDFVSRVVSNAKIASGLHDIWMEIENAPENISPMPGQFAHIAADGVFLRRPISIAGFDRAARRVRFIVRAAGRGTEAIASMRPGDSTKMLMPLGNPFPAERAESGKLWLVGGGVGIAPLIYAARYMSETGHVSGIKSFLGFKNKNEAFGADELGQFGEAVTGIGGFVTDIVRENLASERPAVIFSCGPVPMLAALQKICLGERLNAYASLEARMGCGLGACLVCNCRVKSERAEYRRACKDGPVFGISEVAFG